MKPRALLPGMLAMACLACRTPRVETPSEQPLEPPRYSLRTSCRHLKDERSALVYLILENAGEEKRACYFGNEYDAWVGPDPIISVVTQSWFPVEGWGPRHEIPPGYGVARLIRVNTEGASGNVILKARAQLWDEATSTRIDLSADPTECQLEDGP